jgi:calcineurin-like phosphoesterase family protein
MELQLSLDTWIVSDSHFGHRNIGRYCERPDNHFDLMRDLWLDRVAPSDQVLHLGDLAVYCSEDEARFWCEDLPGRKSLLLGNHDKFGKPFYLKELGFTVLDRPLVLWHDLLERRDPQTASLSGRKAKAGREKRKRTPYLYWHSPRDGKRILFSHYPDSERLDWSINVHGHVHNDSRPYRQLPERDYRNVSVEVVGYGPVRLEDVLYGDAYAGKLGGAGVWRDASPEPETARRKSR